MNVILLYQFQVLVSKACVFFQINHYNALRDNIKIIYFVFHYWKLLGNVYWSMFTVQKVGLVSAVRSIGLQTSMVYKPGPGLWQALNSGLAQDFESPSPPKPGPIHQ